MGAGRLKNFKHEWEKLTTDTHILSYIAGYKIPFDKMPRQLAPPPEPNLSELERKDHRTAINDLLLKGAISKCKTEKGEYLSPYFLRKKPSGEHRFILNLKKLNQFLTAPHFKMESLKNAIKLIERNDHMATIDIKDSYFLIPIAKQHRKFLKFTFERKLYRFNVLPFGLSTAPFVFTKLLKPVMERLRLNLLISVVYLDDILMIGKTKEECEYNVETTSQLLHSLGFILNKGKCQMTPKARCKFLGFIINSEEIALV